MDEQLRKLEREAVNGDPESAEKLKQLRERVLPPYPKLKERWRIINQACDRLRVLCEEQGYEIETHDSHGFYIDVTLGRNRYMLDPTPESTWENGKLIKSYEPGIVVIRDSTHHYEKPNHLAEFNIMEDVGYQQLKRYLIQLTCDVCKGTKQLGPPHVQGWSMCWYCQE